VIRKRWTFGVAVGLALTCALAAGPGGVQDKLPAASGKKQPQIDDATLEKLLKTQRVEETEVRVVLLPTSVTDGKGRNVIGLNQADFRLFEDAQLQQIRFFSSEYNDPVAIAFLLDVSGSMRQFDKIGHAKEAIRFFVDQLKPGDLFALICFADRQVSWVTEFTDDREWFLKRLMVQEGYGQTALHDAVAAAPKLVDERIKGRKAIVMITDGIDNYSELDIDRAVDVARRTNVPIYTIGFTSVSEEMLPKEKRGTDLEILRYVSNETGGRIFSVQDPEELKDAVIVVDEELRHQYLIGYYPPWTRPDGRFHTLRVVTENKGHHVRTRTGYYATP
jgi:Ca-activated chloride channel homolog